jgi:hypothetical protein
MLRSLYDEERSLILEDSHVDRVWATIEQMYPSYFQRLVDECQKGTSVAAATTLASKFRVKVTKSDPRPAGSVPNSVEKLIAHFV